MTIRVLVVDDSPLIRNVLEAIINEQPDMQVVGMAADAMDARDKVRDRNPDVITLDVEMPKVDGLTFLQQLMQVKPTPVIMVSAHTAAGSDITFRALESGAADKITRRFVGLLGEQKASLSLLGSGYVLSVPVFFDTVFFLLVPLARSLRMRTGRNYVLYVLSICAGGAITRRRR